MAVNNVIFKTGTSAQFAALSVKDANTLYWLSDTQELYKGTVRYGIGLAAAAAELGLSPVDASVVIGEASGGGKTVGVQISSIDGNALVLKEDGLYVAEPKERDSIVSGGSVKTVTTANVPYTGAKVGDLYLEITFADAGSTAVYIPASDLVEEYTAGDGISISDHTISAKVSGTLANGLQATEAGLGLALATSTTAGAMSAVDKVFLDSIADTFAAKTDLAALQETVEAVQEAATWQTM